MSPKSERDDPRRVSPALSLPLNQAEKQHTWAQPGLVAYIALEPTGNISPISTHLHKISIVISIALCLFINSGEKSLDYWDSLNLGVEEKLFMLCIVTFQFVVSDIRGAGGGGAAQQGDIPPH